MYLSVKHVIVFPYRLERVHDDCVEPFATRDFSKGHADQPESVEEVDSVLDTAKKGMLIRHGRQVYDVRPQLGRKGWPDGGMVASPSVTQRRAEPVEERFARMTAPGLGESVKREESMETWRRRVERPDSGCRTASIQELFVFRLVPWPRGTLRCRHIPDLDDLGPRSSLGEDARVCPTPGGDAGLAG